MNKNVKFLGAAAAALLTVAPIAAPVVNSVASTTVSAAATAANTFFVKTNDTSINASDSVSTYLNGASVPVSTGKGVIVGHSVATVIRDSDSHVMAASDNFEAGKSYTQSLSVTIGGLEAGKDYNINGTEYTATAQGLISTPITVTRKLNAINPSEAGNPFFVYNGVQVLGTGLVLKDVNSLVGGDSKIVNGAISLTTNNKTKVEAALNQLKSGYTPNGTSSAVKLIAYNSSNGTSLANITYDVNKDLAAQGITVNADGSFKAEHFYINVTATNVLNGKTVSVPVQFNGEADNSFPVFTVTTSEGTKDVKNGETALGYVNVAKNSNFDPNGIFISARVSTINGTAIPFQAVSNPVNTAVPGDYMLRYTATNAEGKSSVISVRVRVLSTEYTDTTVQFKAGYGVNQWAVTSGTYVRFTGTRYLHGTSVRTWDTTTVNGVSYTRVTPDSVTSEATARTYNTWVQTKYLKGMSAGLPTPPATENPGVNAETPMKGVVKVHYNGRGKVALWTKDHKISGQYVAKNSSWKVFASKNMGGKTFYRIGTQNQWIEATYAKFK